MKKYAIPNIYRLGLRFPRTVLLLAILLALFSFSLAKKLKVETDFSALLPKDTQSVKDLGQLKEHFGSMGHLVVTAESDQPALSEEFADELVKQIEELPVVRYVDYRRPVEFFEKRKWLYLENEDLEEMEQRVDRSLVLQEEGVSPVFSHLMDFADEEDRPDLDFNDIKERYEKKWGSDIKPIASGEEGKFVVLRVKANQGAENFEDNRTLVNRIRQIVESLREKEKFKSIQVGYAGSYQTSIETVDLLNKEMAWVTVIVSIALLLILILYFRRFSGAFLVGFPLAIGIVWTGGFVYFLLGHVNIITGFAVAILAGLGSDYGIYLLSRYFSERKEGADFNKACERAFGHTGKATFMAVLTTIGAFGALMLSDFEVFFEFGVVGSLGLFLNYLAMMLVLPSLLKLSDRHPNRFLVWLVGWRSKKVTDSAWATSLVNRIFSPKGAWAAVVLTLVLCGIAALSLPTQSKIYFEDGQMDNRTIPSNQLYDRVKQTLGSSLHPAVLIVNGEESEKKTVELLDKQIREKPEGSLVFKRVLGISSFLPKNTEEKRKLLKSISKKYSKNRYINEGQRRKFLESVHETLGNKNLVKSDLPHELNRMFVSPKDEEVFAVYLYPAMSRGNSEEMNRYRQGILEAKKEAGVDFIPVDESFISADIIDMVAKEAPKGLVLVLLIFSIVLFLTLQDIRRSLIILANLLGSLLFLSGLLYILDIKLNILNIAIFPIILGTGIDCFIHFSHRYNESGNLNDAIDKEIPAILISNLTSIVGFGGLLFTSSVGIRSIGWVAVLGLIIVTVFCTLIFPRCLSLPILGKIKAIKINPKALEA